MTSNLTYIQLFSIPSDFGRGANEGCYYPQNLLLIASFLKRAFPDVYVEIVDKTLDPDAQPEAPIVGISATSTENYANVLTIAKKAKMNGSIVILGGPHTSHLANQILRNRSHLVDYVIRGFGEKAFTSLIEVLRSAGKLSDVPGLSWVDSMGQIRQNPDDKTSWHYGEFIPVDFHHLKSPLHKYWDNFRRYIDPSVDATFLVFTHFGCGYHNTGSKRAPAKGCLSAVCSFCSLEGPVISRTGNSIVTEVLDMIEQCQIRPGSKVLLKCYGDNVGTQTKMLKDLAETIDSTPAWHQYEISWTFYCQSTRLNEHNAQLLARIGARNLYIGFDSADDRVQRINGLGTSLKAHEKAVEIAFRYNIKIQAGFVVGCAGETRESLEKTLAFANHLKRLGVLERINSAVMFVIPGTPAYEALCEREPWIRDYDLLPTREIQLLWLKHFCPDLGISPEDGMELLEEAANYLDKLSPGPHASMGFVSKALTAQISEECAI